MPGPVAGPTTPTPDDIGADVSAFITTNRRQGRAGSRQFNPASIVAVISAIVSALPTIMTLVEDIISIFSPTPTPTPVPAPTPAPTPAHPPVVTA